MHIAANPQSKMLRGKARKRSTRSERSGDYRILCVLEFEIRTLTVLRVGDRKDIYFGL